MTSYEIKNALRFFLYHTVPKKEKITHDGKNQSQKKYYQGIGPARQTFNFLKKNFPVTHFPGSCKYKRSVIERNKNPGNNR
jgi:hypothetical protein